MSSSVARDSLSMFKSKLKDEVNSKIGEDILKEIIFK
jgi:hypothetical protein